MDTIGTAEKTIGKTANSAPIGVLHQSGFLLILSLITFLGMFLLITFGTPSDFRIDAIRTNPDRVAASLALAPYRGIWVTADLLGFLTFATTTLGFWVVGFVLSSLKGGNSAKIGRIILALALCLWLLVTYYRIAFEGFNITSSSEIPPLVGIVGLDITIQRIMIPLFALGVTLMSWSFFQSGMLRRIGLISTVLSGLTFLGALILLLQNQGFPPVVALFCAYAIGIGLLLKK